MTGILLILGALPFILGGIQNWYMLNNPDSLLPYGLIAFVFLSAWCFIAFLLNKDGKRTRQIVLFLNLIAALDLLLVGIQELIFHAYWMNHIGLWSQLFYLPVLNLGVNLTSWSHTLFLAYAAGFILMICCSFVGCNLRKKFQNNL